jgi:hypothetical protein
VSPEQPPEEPGRRVTEETGQRYLRERLRDLEASNDTLSDQADELRDQLIILRERVQRANQRILSMGRLVRVWIVIRAAIRRPWKLLQLPADISAALNQRPGSAAVDEDDQETPEAWADRAARQAAERREAAARSIHRRAGADAGPAARRLRIALIADAELTADLAPDCELLPIDPDHWREQLETQRPDLLVVESAWHGNDGAWQYRVAWYAHPQAIALTDLRALVEWCVQRDIPTVFWDTAGPAHFDRFRWAAQLFDQIFTVDEDSIERFEALPQRRAASVDLLLSAAQPRRHHPLGGEEAEGRPAYAGAYPRDAALAQREGLEALLDAGREHDLVIYDRSLGSDPGLDGLPTRFQPHLAGWLPSDRLAAAYRRHPVFLVADTSPRSGSALPARAFAVLASGTPVLITPSRAGERLFGDLIAQAGERTAAAELERLISDTRQRRRVRSEALPLIGRRHTYAHRLAQIATAVGQPSLAPPTGAAVTLLVLHDDEGRRQRLVETIVGQRRRPDEIVVGSADWERVGRPLQEQLAAGLPEVAVRLVEQGPDEPPGARFRRLAAAAANPWMALLDSGHGYGEAHLDGLAACIGFDLADVIGSAGSIAQTDPGSALEYAEVPAVHPHAALVRRTLLLERGWPDDARAAAAMMTAWRADGVRVFAAGADAFIPADAPARRPAGVSLTGAIR